MKLLYGTAVSLLLCVALLAACGKKEDSPPSNYVKIVEISKQASDSSLKPTEEEWQSSAIGFVYKFKQGREVLCIRMYNSSAISCDWSK